MIGVHRRVHSETTLEESILGSRRREQWVERVHVSRVLVLEGIGVGEGPARVGE